jgi:hypothetical protein
MKFYILIVLLLICLTGCKCVNQEILLEMQEYLNTNGQRAIEYVEADKKLSR